MSFYFPANCARFKDEVESYKRCSALFFIALLWLSMLIFFRGVCKNIMLLPTMEFHVRIVLACFWALASFL
jgi:hypothetical protein